jgi:hypothetical protein
MELLLSPRVRAPIRRFRGRDSGHRRARDVGGAICGLATIILAIVVVLGERVFVERYRRSIA